MGKRAISTRKGRQKIGEWEIKEPLEQREADWLKKVKYDPDRWHEVVVNNGKEEMKEWKQKDAYEQEWYDKLSAKDNAHNRREGHVSKRVICRSNKQEQ